MVDITSRVQNFLQSIKAEKGIVTVAVIGSTAAITTIEYEPGLIKDLPAILDKIAPQGHYHHDQAWGDGNGHAHLRSTLMGTSQTFVVDNGSTVLGTWQQIILVDFDNRQRTRKVAIHFIGSSS